VRFTSSRDRRSGVTLSDALERGLAPDGGLYVPQTLPAFDEETLEGAPDLVSIGHRLLEPFFEGDRLAPELHAICREAFSFETPVLALKSDDGRASVLELFHGPTCAFKDVGARFLAAAFRRLVCPGLRTTIVVATSGDTGGAVAAAFHRVEPFEVVLLYPKGLVSSRQAQQLSCWGENVRTFAVRGNFDDCQRLAKQALQDAELARTHRLSSANSINIARLLPQAVYYAYASLVLYRREGRKPGFIIPAGNLGNTVACLWARALGLPIGPVVMATNENSPVPEYLAHGLWMPRSARGTISSAMDVGDPSNMERIRLLFGDWSTMRGNIRGFSVSEDEIRETIRSDFAALDRVWCPHSATAAHVWRQLRSEAPDERWVVVATAHPAKFNDIVEPLVGPVAIPPALADLLALPRYDVDLEPTIEDLRARLTAGH